MYEIKNDQEMCPIIVDLHERMEQIPIEPGHNNQYEGAYQTTEKANTYQRAIKRRNIGRSVAYRTVSYVTILYHVSVRALRC